MRTQVTTTFLIERNGEDVEAVISGTYVRGSYPERSSYTVPDDPHVVGLTATVDDEEIALTADEAEQAEYLIATRA